MLTKTEVRELNMAIGIEKNVIRFQITMNVA